LAAPADGLSAREVEVLEVLATGLTDREIAERLSISPHTVHRHVSNILAKLGLPSRSAAAAYAARRGLAR
ncbi:MAG: helix-turn-helix domain-containing protein, partial [Acidimicrobiales bacterium]